MLAQGLYGIYNIAIISWLFIYLRDSFVTASEQYRWSQCLKDAAYKYVIHFMIERILSFEMWYFSSFNNNVNLFTTLDESVKSTSMIQLDHIMKCCL